MAFDGTDLNPLLGRLLDRAIANPEDAATLLDLATVAQIQGRFDDYQTLQAGALKGSRAFRRPPDTPFGEPLRLLALFAPASARGRNTFMNNTPLEFLLEGSNISLDIVYVGANEEARCWPEHDVLFVAADETEDNHPVLRRIARSTSNWHRPILNAPMNISRLTRTGSWQILNTAPGIFIPFTRYADRDTLEGVAEGRCDLSSPSGSLGFPIIVRPVWSHAGSGLERIDHASTLASYLGRRPDNEFFISAFIDYRSDDGLFRKYRVALIGGKAYAVHLAISQNWVVHYLTADMKCDSRKRDEEARFMGTFDTDFGERHAAAFSVIARRTALDYLIVDCGETRDGQLLVFEIGTGMIVHSMDPPDIFPYKRTQMEKVFRAFQGMLFAAAKQH